MLSRLSLAGKLLCLLVPFSLVVLLLASVLALDRWHSLDALQRSRALVGVAVNASQLIDALQTERGLSNGFLRSQAATLPPALQQARQASDQAQAAFGANGGQHDASSRPEVPQGELQTLRDRIQQRALPAEEAFAAYTQRIDSLIGLIARLAEANNDGELLRRSAALLSLQCEKEFAGRERGFVNGVLSGGGFSQAAFAQAVGMAARQDACAGQFQLMASSDLRQQMAALDQGADTQAVLAMRAQWLQQGLGQPLALTPAAWFQAASRRIAALKRVQDALLQQLAQRVDDKVARAKDDLWLTLSGSGLVIALLGGVGWSIYRSVHRPVRALERMMTAMSRDFDLGPRARIAGDDEVARMGHAFDQLVDAFAQTLQQVKANAHQVVEAANAMLAISNRAADASTAQSRSAAEIAAAVELMTAGIASVTSNTRLSLTVAQQMQHSVSDGRERMRHTALAITQTSSVLEGAGAGIALLQQKSEDIRSIITAIREISDQTNLLALNAAIEAARAGEMGRGFAVVADEVRKLAERTGKETLQITALIEDIRGETRQAAGKMDDARSRMESGLQQVGQTVTDLELIHQEAGDAASKSQGTASAMAEQTAASSDVSHNISVIAGLAEDNANMVQQVVALSSRLNTSASQLVMLVDRFHHTR